MKDAETGEVIQDATIYEVNQLDATLTNTRGEFDLTVKAKTDYLTFAISRENYQDTIIQVSSISEMSVSLKPIKKEKRSLSSRFEIETKKLVKFFTPDESRRNAKNVTMEEDRFFQFSLVPMVGTNGKLSGQIRNNLSVNLLAGYAYGVNGVELGGFYNIDRREMKGVQIGGFGNAVGGESHGVQLAGFLNTTKGYTNGVQAAGFLNIVTDDVKGVQAAGFVNLSKKVGGAQVAGFVNLATKEVNGFQGAGFVNMAKSAKGVQTSGFLNLTNEVDGAQISGFLNMTKKLKGVQIGIVNIADTVVHGVPIGLFSFVKSGLHQLAIEHNEFMPYHVAFRSGVHQFYSVLSAGIDPSKDNLWQYGLGFGSQFNLKKKWYGNVELVAHSIQNPERDQHNDELNLLNRLNLNVGYQIGKHLSINAGPTLNLYLTKVYDSSTDTYGDLNQSGFYESITDDGLHLSAWVGYAASVRF
ncbi:LA_2272 family surface repeat-containing protein [Reichenbachiella sp.]|uniref:LA_2272 family surface repeat-containing protein n=1 Tax=Reichenbachiella sp. TaxID=2184521 RepID=UPI003BAFF71D